ncbi:serine/arginine repetitive matrix protein 2-like [Falco biarmicus]|uniref:serine/arginine repetitive matrix protein 2-like n=1 Tax=Falco biarmicus TaxID=345155 RepID=UPI0024BCDF96|nr:serine/arginine repetitive matrix protein 2-like [Falco biarmicus]
MRRDDGRKPLASPDRYEQHNAGEEGKGRATEKNSEKARAGAGSARSHHTHPARFGGGPGRAGPAPANARRSSGAPRPRPRPAYARLAPGTRRAAAAADGPHTRARQAPNTAHLRSDKTPEPETATHRLGARRTALAAAKPRPPSRNPPTPPASRPDPRPKQARSHAGRRRAPDGGGGVGGRRPLLPPVSTRRTRPGRLLTPKNPRRREARHLRRARPRRAAWGSGGQGPGRDGRGRRRAPSGRPIGHGGSRAVTAPPLGGGGLADLGATAEARALAGAERGLAEERSAATEARRHGGRRRSADAPPPPRAEETALPRRGRPLDARRAHSKDGLRPNTRRGLSARDRTRRGGRQRDTSPGTAARWGKAGNEHSMGRSRQRPRRRHPPAQNYTASPRGRIEPPRVFKPPPGRAAFDPRGSPREGCAETRTLGTWPWGEGNDLQGPAAVPPPLPPSGERPPAGGAPDVRRQHLVLPYPGAGVSLSDPALRPERRHVAGAAPLRAGTRPGEGGRHASRLAHRRRGSPPSTRSRLRPPPLPPVGTEVRGREGRGGGWGGYGGKPPPLRSRAALYPGTPGGRLSSFAAGPVAQKGRGRRLPPIPKEKAATRSPGHARLTTCRPRLSSFTARRFLPPPARGAQRPGKARARTLPRQHTSPSLRRARARQGPTTRRTARPLQPGGSLRTHPSPPSFPRTAPPAAENCRGDGRAERGAGGARLGSRGEGTAGRRREAADGEERRGKAATRRAGPADRPAGATRAGRCRDKRRRRRRRRRAAAESERRARARLPPGRDTPSPPARVRRGEGEPSPPARRGGSREEALQLHGRTRGYGRGSARPDSRALRRQPAAGGEARVRPHPGPRTFLHARGSDRRRTDAGRGGEGGARLPAPPRPCRHGGGQRGTGIPARPAANARGRSRTAGGGVSPRGDSAPPRAPRTRLGRGSAGAGKRESERVGTIGAARPDARRARSPARHSPPIVKFDRLLDAPAGRGRPRRGRSEDLTNHPIAARRVMGITPPDRQSASFMVGTTTVSDRLRTSDFRS